MTLLVLSAIGRKKQLITFCCIALIAGELGCGHWTGGMFKCQCCSLLYNSFNVGCV